MVMLAVFCLVAPVAGQAAFTEISRKPILSMMILNILLKKKLLQAYPDGIVQADQIRYASTGSDYDWTCIGIKRRTKGYKIQ